MPDQLGMFETAAYNTLQVKLHSRTDDPVTSKRAASTTNIPKQSQDVLEIITRYGPGTPWELAHDAWEHDLRLGKENVTEVYYAIQRRQSDLVTAEKVRIVGERQCTIKEHGKLYHVLEAVK